MAPGPGGVVQCINVVDIQAGTDGIPQTAGDRPEGHGRCQSSSLAAAQDLAYVGDET
jgi:hypothetical protein